MRQIKIGDMVWCSMDEPAYEPNGCFVGTVREIRGEKYIVSRDTNTLIYKMHELKYEQLTPLCYKPMNKETELLSGWITDLIKDTDGGDDERFGWIYKNGNGEVWKGDPYPIKYWIDVEGTLVIKKYVEDDAVYNVAIEKINDIFNCNPNTQMVAQYIKTRGELRVKLYQMIEKEATTSISMNDIMKTAMVSINKWMYFGWNYLTVEHGGQHLPKFLVEAKWTCNLEHMVSKWSNVTRKKNPHAYISTFYSELDMENRKAMIEWVMENFNDEKRIVQEHP